MNICFFCCDPHRFLYFATDTHRQTQTLFDWVVKEKIILISSYVCRDLLKLTT